MAGRWICSKQREMDLFIEEMAREMYLRDWKRNMKKVHFIIQAFHKINPDYENHKSYMISQWIDEQMKMI